MAKMNVWKRLFPVRTHEGAVARKVDAKSELRRTVLTCLLWEDTFYEKGSDIAKRMATLAAENSRKLWPLSHARRVTRCSSATRRSSWFANSRAARARARS
jgi:hypothetical protein